jgi:hypothetical protein
MTEAEKRVEMVKLALIMLGDKLRLSGRRRHEMCSSIYHAGGGKIEPAEFGNDGYGSVRARFHLIRLCLDQISPPPFKGKGHGRAG